MRTDYFQLRMTPRERELTEKLVEPTGLASMSEVLRLGLRLVEERYGANGERPPVGSRRARRGKGEAGAI